MNLPLGLLLLPMWPFGACLVAMSSSAMPELHASQFSAKSPGTPSVRVEHHQDMNKKILIALISTSSLLGGILLLLSCFWIYRIKNLKNSNSENPQSSDVTKGISMSPIMAGFSSTKVACKKGWATIIDYETLEAATNNFHNSNILGKVGSWSLYKARFKEELLAVVKRLDAGGREAERVFENEVDWLSKIKHQNIISLLGYCIHGETRCLVYEMLQNGSLEDQLHGSGNGSALSWNLRMKIAVDVARGLEYLHEHCNPPVIHRDIKSSSILLDANHNAKLSDFGLAVTLGSQNTNIKLSGTLGYVAPEYLIDGKLTDKSDVYAFGIVLLELLMGRRPVENKSSAEFQSIVTWAMPQLTDRSKLPSILDPTIRYTMDLKHLYQVAAVAVLCVQPEPSYRPLITDVLHSLIPLLPTELGGSLRITDPVPVHSHATA